MAVRSMNAVLNSVGTATVGNCSSGPERPQIGERDKCAGGGGGWTRNRAARLRHPPRLPIATYLGPSGTEVSILGSQRLVFFFGCEI